MFLSQDSVKGRMSLNYISQAHTHTNTHGLFIALLLEVHSIGFDPGFVTGRTLYARQMRNSCHM
uniref:Uncharacterized protein n=1 Tax=Daphnia magna TaxID=35525 RepID=A0A0N8DPT0_9CRUS